jgi:hypothetical protein
VIVSAGVCVGVYNSFATLPIRFSGGTCGVFIGQLLVIWFAVWLWQRRAYHARMEMQFAADVKRLSKAQ